MFLFLSVALTQSSFDVFLLDDSRRDKENSQKSAVSVDTLGIAKTHESDCRNKVGIILRGVTVFHKEARGMRVNKQEIYAMRQPAPPLSFGREDV